MIPAAHGSLTGRLNALVIDGCTEAGRAELRPRGELVHGCAEVLDQTLTALPDGVRRVELDMAAVVFMDTGGLQFLEVLDAYSHRRRIPVAATRWTGQPRRILELAGLDTADPLRAVPRRAVPEPAPPAPSAVALERAEQLHLLRAEVEQLRQAIVSRPVIDQARGILMAAHSCTSEEAWTILRKTSQLSNTKLRTVAAALTAGTGSDGPLPPEEVRTALRTAVRSCLN
ncbi:ANTAR domain-containing protein [Streptomyces sp. NBC_00124]|uniref:ANTAR domain-containing protein n=1 Tax=Streptomyces sp. NBC_00124 TaxID=2975662 RepID=UPI00224E0755|nr:ANTAR domain-containing protein [Streptomyces sp. NBC_00124]MCX5363849.1 ANTAR domain-containing protein [Streptomyces sp. NBC_00124]